MAAILQITVRDEQDSQNLLEAVSGGRSVGGISPLNSREQARALAEYFTKLASGHRTAKVQVMAENDGGAAGTWTVACTRANATSNFVAISALTRATSVTTTNGSAVLTAVGSTFGMVIGDVITGTGIPIATTLLSLTDTTITMSANATASATVTATVYARATVFLEGVDFLRGADDTATGDNLAAAINAQITAGGPIAGLFASVAAVTGTITLTAAIKSIGAQQITIVTDDATAFAITNTGAGTRGTLIKPSRVYLYGSAV